MASVDTDFTFEIFVADTMLDESPNQLKDSAEHLELVDTAFFFDTSCPPLLRPERKVDVILHFNYTGGSQIKVRRHNSDFIWNKKIRSLYCIKIMAVG